MLTAAPKQKPPARGRGCVVDEALTSQKQMRRIFAVSTLVQGFHQTISLILRKNLQETVTAESHINRALLYLEESGVGMCTGQKLTCTCCKTCPSAFPVIVYYVASLCYICHSCFSASPDISSLSQKCLSNPLISRPARITETTVSATRPRTMVQSALLQSRITPGTRRPSHPASKSSSISSR